MSTKAIDDIDSYFRSHNNVPVTRANIKLEEWEAVKRYIEDMQKRLSDYGWEASARHAQATGGWQ